MSPCMLVRHPGPSAGPSYRAELSCTQYTAQVRLPERECGQGVARSNAPVPATRRTETRGDRTRQWRTCVELVQPNWSDMGIIAIDMHTRHMLHNSSEHAHPRITRA